MNKSKNRSRHPVHASIHLAAQGTQYERGGIPVGNKPFALITSDLADVLCQPSRLASSSISSPHSGRIEGMAPFNYVVPDKFTTHTVRLRRMLAHALTYLLILSTWSLRFSLPPGLLAAISTWTA